MSGGPKPTFLMPAYDAQELRRRMAVGFTIGELYRFAEKLQVPATPAWSNAPQEAARDIVRHFERSGALPFLVEALREAKPLVEWPEPVRPAEAPEPAAAPAGSTSLGAPLSAAFDGAPAGAESPGDRPTPIATLSAAAVFASARGPSDRPPPAPGGFAPAVMPLPSEPPAAPSSAGAAAPPARTDVDGDLAAFMAAGSVPAPPTAGPPSSKAAPASAWPGTVRPGGSPPPKAPPDLRIIAGVGAAVLIGAVAVAFFVGRASSAAPAESGTTSGEPPADQATLSHRVVDALSASLTRVARDCQIDLSTLRGRPLFEVAYRRCGPLPAQAVIPQRTSYDPDPAVAEARPDEPKKGRPTTGNKLQKVEASPGSGGAPGGACLSRCSQSHGACTSRCGAEPKQGSQYDAYQACLGGCLKALSQCKMGCQ